MIDEKRDGDQSEQDRERTRGPDQHPAKIHKCLKPKLLFILNKNKFVWKSKKVANTSTAHMHFRRRLCSPRPFNERNENNSKIKT